ncbi:MAG: hypothetical protein GY811_13235 [Myxococcales bacterium]|nr:hypothetical protein [Myxococcales bacterium]
MRLGEILVAAGLVNEQHLEDALARQHLNRDQRLGTHFVHLGLVTPDQIALALAKQSEIPPALIRHFVHHDPKVANLIGPKAAQTHSLLPIAFSRAGGRRLAVCFRDPKQPELIGRLEKALGIAITPCVASELAISVYLDHYYGVQPLFGGAAAAKPKRPEFEDGVDIDFDEDESGLEALQLVDLDHRDVERAQPEAFIPEAQRQSAIRQALATAQVSSAGIDALDLIAAEPQPEPKKQPTPKKVEATPPGPSSTPIPAPAKDEWSELPEVLDAIKHADQRSAVSDSIMSFLEQRFAAGMMFTIKDGLAMGHRGFGGHLDDKDTVAALMLPLQKNILGAAHDSKELWRGDPAELSSAAQDRFLGLFAMSKAPSDVVVVPVSVGSRVVCLLYAHAHQGIELDDPDVDELAEVAEATKRAFARLIKKSRAATTSS